MDNILWQESKASDADRWDVLRQLPGTIWLTGLPGSGKSTLAFAFEKLLLSNGNASFALDGDNVRHGLNRDLGFSPQARSENIRRVAEVSKLMNDAGLIVITAFISPYREDRQMARQIIGAERFAEVFVDAPLEVCERRDPKGHYRKARAGLIPEFTGVSAPYESPQTPDLRLSTGVDLIEDDLALLLAYVHRRFGHDRKRRLSVEETNPARR